MFVAGSIDGLGAVDLTLALGLPVTVLMLTIVLSLTRTEPFIFFPAVLGRTSACILVLAVSERSSADVGMSLSTFSISSSNASSSSTRETRLLGDLFLIWSRNKSSSTLSTPDPFLGSSALVIFTGVHDLIIATNESSLSVMVTGKGATPGFWFSIS